MVRHAEAVRNRVNRPVLLTKESEPSSTSSSRSVCVQLKASKHQLVVSKKNRRESKGRHKERPCNTEAGAAVHKNIYDQYRCMHQGMMCA